MSTYQLFSERQQLQKLRTLKQGPMPVQQYLLKFADIAIACPSLTEDDKLSTF